MKKFDLNIEVVLEHWDIASALREIIANALDESLLTGTLEPNIYKDSHNKWYIKDFGRGLKYDHFTQNENEEKLKHSDKVIGKFGVGLKDALATFNRRGVKVLIQSKYGDIHIEKATKSGFNDITTLHAIIDEPSFPSMKGTEFSFEGMDDTDMESAKSFFLLYSGNEVLGTTKYGDIIKKNNDSAKIYINGLCVATEENFLFSYNITSPTKKLLRSLNRERTNVGRSAYTDRIKSILLGNSNKQCAEALTSDLERIQTGDEHDELQWIDVQLHACKVLNHQDRVLFLTASEIMSSDSKYIDYAKDEGYRIITIPDNLKSKVYATPDIKGNEMMSIEKYATEWNQNFEFDFVKQSQLNKKEKDIFAHKDTIMSWFPSAHKKVKNIAISNAMRPDDYTGNDAAGLWISDEKKIIIHRNQLQRVDTFAGTFIHELIHAMTDTDDRTLEFEHELTNALGKLSVLLIKNKHENKRKKGLLNFFK